jgi:acetyl esterase/lipase
MLLYDKKDIEKHRNFIRTLEEKEKNSAARKVKIILLPTSSPLNIKSSLVNIVYRPTYLTDPPYPTLLHIRGTGYNTSARYYSYITCSHLAEKSGCQVIDIDHRLAPEHPCWDLINDVYEAYKAIIKNARALKIDTDKIAISGYSSGGNLSALTAIKAKKNKFPLALQILISPITDLSRKLKKFKFFEDKDTFKETLAKWFIKLYLPNESNGSNPDISPFWSNCLTDFPPTYFLFGEFDRFRSDSESYSDKLNQFGFWTHKSLFKNEIHAMFWKNIRVIETVAAQLRMGLNLTTIPKAISPLFLKPSSASDKKLITVPDFILNNKRAA